MSLPDAPPLRIVVNADDLGLHPAVRRAVEQCAAKGSVTSASVMANGPDLASVRPIPGVSLGAHLNALRGKPLSPAHEVRSLVDGRGLFLGSYARFALRALRGAIDLGELRLEWSRQVALLRERGLPLSHADGEKHTHCLPGLFAVACEVAEEHGISFVRRSVERHGRAGPLRASRAALARVVRHGPASLLRSAALRAMCARAEVPAPLRAADAVWGIAAQGTCLSLTRFLRDMDETVLPSGPPSAGSSARIASVEVVCHPGEPHAGDPALPESFGRMRVAALWEPEFRALRDEPWREAVRSRGWMLTGFEGL